MIPLAQTPRLRGRIPMRERKLACWRNDRLGASLAIRLADSWWSRARGLLGRGELASGTGLLLTPCSSVHTIGMRHPIDVVFLRADGTVIKSVARLRPWRAATARGARAVLELRAGTVSQYGIREGDRVGWNDDQMQPFENLGAE